MANPAPLLQLQVPSTNHQRTYTLTLHADGVASCSCPAWRFNRAPAGQKLCKHLTRFAAQGGNA